MDEVLTTFWLDTERESVRIGIWIVRTLCAGYIVGLPVEAMPHPRRWGGKQILTRLGQERLGGLPLESVRILYAHKYQRQSKGKPGHVVPLHMIPHLLDLLGMSQDVVTRFYDITVEGLAQTRVLLDSVLLGHVNGAIERLTEETNLVTLGGAVTPGLDRLSQQLTRLEQQLGLLSESAAAATTSSHSPPPSPR